MRRRSRKSGFLQREPPLGWKWFISGFLKCPFESSAEQQIALQNVLGRKK